MSYWDVIVVIVTHTYAIWASRAGFKLYCPLGLVIIIMRVVIIINRDLFSLNNDALLMKRHFQSSHHYTDTPLDSSPSHSVSLVMYVVGPGLVVLALVQQWDWVIRGFSALLG